MQFGVENHGMYHPRFIFGLGDFNAFALSSSILHLKQNAIFA